MSISAAFSNSYSGLNTSSKRAELVSNNVANAMTEGYSRREALLSSGQHGGVRVEDIRRIESVVATVNRRGAQAQFSNSQPISEALDKIVSAVGVAGEPGSLSEQFAKFENSLVAASNNPSDTQVLGIAVTQASRLAGDLNDVSSKLSAARGDADAAIAENVAILNRSLETIDDLNQKILRATYTNTDVSGLLDQRDRTIDTINEIIPVNVVKREHDQVALFTPSGGVLIDGPPTKFDFAATGTITHNMTLAGGALSPLNVNGSPVVVNGTPGFFDGSKLAALFEVRDATIPNFNNRIDALAADLASRFQSSTVDPTLAVTDPGLFTDGGAQYGAANQLGFAGRIIINTALDPSVGGDVWKLRDGINTTVPGAVGQNSILKNYVTAAQNNTSAPTGLGIGTPMSASGFSASLVAGVNFEQVDVAGRLAFSSAQVSSLQTSETNLNGVDIDQQVQRLLEIEKAYAANARVINVLDELFSRLMEI